MPSISRHSDASATQLLNQIVIAPSSSDSEDLLDHIITSIRAHGNDNEPLLSRLGTFAAEKEQALQEFCTEDRAREMLASVSNLKSTQTHIVDLTKQILDLRGGVDRSTQGVVVTSRELVDVQTRVQFNVAESLKQINSCLDLLLQARGCRESLDAGRYIAALQRVKDIERKLEFDENDIMDTSSAVVQYLSLMIPAIKSQIIDDTLNHLHDWLTHIREEQQDDIGKKTLKKTSERKKRLNNEAQNKKPFLKQFPMNSAVELSFAEADDEEDDEQMAMDITFTPLLEYIHIQTALGGLETFRAEYATLRERQMEGFLSRKNIKLSLAGGSAGGQQQQPSDIRSFLESVAGFMIVERCTAGKVPRFRSKEDLKILWRSMISQSLVEILRKSLLNVKEIDQVRDIKETVVLFVQSMKRLNFSVSAFDNLLHLFDRYIEVLLDEQRGSK